MTADVWQNLAAQVKAARDRVRRKIAEAVFESPDRPAIENIRELTELRRMVDELIDGEIIRGRELGASWDLLGTSKQQAQQRYRRAVARRHEQSMPVDETAPAVDAIGQPALTSALDTADELLTRWSPGRAHPISGGEANALAVLTRECRRQCPCSMCRGSAS